MTTKITLPKLGESVVEGLIGRWLKQPGDKVELDEPLVEVESDKVNAEIPSSVTGTLMEILVAEGETVSVGTPIAIIAEDVAPAESASPAANSNAPHTYTPAVRQLAAQTGIDPAMVAGSGEQGRVTMRDMQAAASAPKASPVRIDESHRAASHAWTMVEVDVTSLVRFRESCKGEIRQREGVNLTYLPFVIKAAVEGLREYPILNSRWDEDQIVPKKQINIAIAVELESGLTMPVIKDADQKSVLGLAHAIRNLATRARSGSLQPDDMQGATFTINNTGTFGSVMSAPIINYPQVAVLSMETIMRRPVVVGDGIAIRDMMNLCMSIDHRILDAAVIGRFLRSVKRRLEAYDDSTPIY